MINRSKQNWAIGNTVKVGFLSLTVLAAVATPGDFKPDAYVLASKTAFYEFVPHKGLTKISEADAQTLIARANRAAAQHAGAVIAKASAAAAHAAIVTRALEAA